MKDEKRKIAEKILELEKECQKGHNVNENMKEMTLLTQNLSLSDLLEIDSYICKKFFDKKKKK